MTYIFKDFHQNTVKFSHRTHPFTTHARHVWIICVYQDRWLLTEHPSRGIEFPGGKVEVGETSYEAGIREVREETGGIVEDMEYVGQFVVKGRSDTVYKDVYFATVSDLTTDYQMYETKGPVVLERLPHNIKADNRYSFMMRDDVIINSLNYLNEKKKIPKY